MLDYSPDISLGLIYSTKEARSRDLEVRVDIAGIKIALLKVQFLAHTPGPEEPTLITVEELLAS